jgi:hypothetical protein
VARDPTQPNLRQVHVIHAELHDDCAPPVSWSAGEMGENVTTRGVDLLGLPTGADCISAIAPWSRSPACATPALSWTASEGPDGGGAGARSAKAIWCAKPASWASSCRAARCAPATIGVELPARQPAGARAGMSGTPPEPDFIAPENG